MSVGGPRLFTQNRSSVARSNGRVSWFLFTCVFVLMEGHKDLCEHIFFIEGGSHGAALWSVEDAPCKHTVFP